MSIIVEREIDRAVEQRLTPARKTGRPPVVRFSPLFSEPPLAARRRKRALMWISVGGHVLLAVVVMLLPRRAQTLVEPALPFDPILIVHLP